MAENQKQEVEFDLGGKTYRVRPTYEVLVRIEGATNQACRQLGNKCYAVGTLQALRAEITEISIGEMSVILFQMVRDQKGAPDSAVAVGEILMDEGYSQLCGPVGDFLTRAFLGHKEHVKQIENAKGAAEGDAGETQAPD